jgi:hypothetical protein
MIRLGVQKHRIVAFFEALMALCDQLKANLTTTRKKLLNALLHEALLPPQQEVA